MDTAFETFIEKIKLTELQKQDAQTKIANVSSALHAKYYPNQVYDGSTKILIGSHGKHTNIRPPRDIDLLFKMPPAEFARYDALAGNKQSQLLQDIRGVLKDKFTTTDKINAWGKVILISFAEGTHIVELLPAWKLESGAYRIPNSENGGSWDTWHPVAEIQNIHDSNVQTKKTKKLVRMMKAWVRSCGVPLKSFMLELLVVNYLRDEFNNEVNISYPKFVSEFFRYILLKKNSTVTSPGSPTPINIGDSWYSRTESAFTRSKKAIEYEESGKLNDASLEWKKIFGDDFPMAGNPAPAVDSTSDKIAELTRAYSSDAEEDLTRDYGIEIRPVVGYEVRIDAEVTQNGFRTGWLTDFLTKRFPLRKGKKLKFRIQKNTVPGPYRIMWKVRNFGDEARKAGGLRGEITSDAGSGEKQESTLYHGEHYVECYVIKGNVCVAMGKVLVPIGSEYD
jgi:hypothetical protein